MNSGSRRICATRSRRSWKFEDSPRRTPRPAITGQKQADLSHIANGRFVDYSVWRLMKILSPLGTDVLIAVKSIRRK